MKVDKILHIIAGIFISGIIAIPCYSISHNLFIGIWSSLSGIIAGIIKEWCDKIYTSSYDKQDFYATCIGVLITILTIIIVHVIL